MVKVHYFFDPLCGWCFGATDLIDVLNNRDDLEIILHPGGMLENQFMSDEFRAKIKIYDPKIASLTGQQFGQKYTDRIKSNEPIQLDSFVTAQAVMAMESINACGVDMLKAIQFAHYQKGLDVSQPEVLTDLAIELGVEKDAYQVAFNYSSSQLDKNINNSRQLMGQWSVQGFPTLIAETNDGLKVLPHSSFYNQVEQWKTGLDTWLT